MLDSFHSTLSARCQSKFSFPGGQGLKRVLTNGAKPLRAEQKLLSAWQTLPRLVLDSPLRAEYGRDIVGGRGGHPAVIHARKESQHALGY